MRDSIRTKQAQPHCSLPAAIRQTIARTRRLRWLAVLACLSLATLLLPAGGSEPAGSEHHRGHPGAPPASIWFHPLPAADAGGVPVGGSTDFLSLFQTGAPWPHVMEKTQVFGLYAGWITTIDPQVLQLIVAFTNAHNMAIEIEAPALQALASCGSGVEGYVPYGQSREEFTMAYLQRLKDLGAQRILVKVDEPFYFGSVVNDPRSCHFPLEQVALEVGQYTQLVKSVFPDAAVGDVEPIIASAYAPNVIEAMEQWHNTYRAVTGASFPFFFADIDFSNPAWPAIVKQLENRTRQSGIAFGILYIGDPTDVSDAEWAGKVISRFHTYQDLFGGEPDYVLFQSWEKYPRLCLPENDPTTFTGVIEAYIDSIQ
jgi:hypothetical protein